MRNLMIFAAIMIALGSFMAQVADRMAPASAATAPVAGKAATADQPAPTPSRSLSLDRDNRGHFLTEARINGQRINVMVDTGASLVAVNESSAARFGLIPREANSPPT